MAEPVQCSSCSCFVLSSLLLLTPLLAGEAAQIAMMDCGRDATESKAVSIPFSTSFPPSLPPSLSTRSSLPVLLYPSFSTRPSLPVLLYLPSIYPPLPALPTIYPSSSLPLIQHQILREWIPICRCVLPHSHSGVDVPSTAGLGHCCHSHLSVPVRCHSQQIPGALGPCDWQLHNM